MLRIIIETDEGAKVTTSAESGTSVTAPGDAMDAAGAAPGFSAPEMAESAYLETAAEVDTVAEIEAAADGGEPEFVGAGPAGFTVEVGAEELGTEYDIERAEYGDDLVEMTVTADSDAEDAGGAPGEGGTELGSEEDAFVEITQEEPLAGDSVGSDYLVTDDKEGAGEAPQS